MISPKFDLYRSEWLELVFDDRNKAYGAYELRQHYDNTLLKALGFTVLPIVFLFLLSSFIMTRKAIPVADPIIPVLLNAHPPVITKPPVTPPKPRIEPPVRNVATIKYPIMVATVDNKAVNPPNLDDLKNAVISTETKKGIPGIDSIDLRPSTSSGVTESNEVKEFGTIEINPQFPGGEAAWAKFLQKNLRYPSQAIEEGISGKVFVSFVVEKDGHLSDITLIRGPGHGLDEEAIRVLKLVPPWKPGIQNGRPVRVRYNMPFNFQIPPSD
ncbi:MAG: energy transducer TonB [Sphingobacteriales bacterium]